MTRLMLTATLAAVLAACSGPEAGAQAPSQAGAGAPLNAPVASEAANRAGQKPAFAGQTRAPEVRSNVAVEVTDYVTGIQNPWGIAFLPNGALLITEKPGRLRVFENGKLSPPVEGMPKVHFRAQSGLLGVAIDPKYEQNGLIYFAFSEGDRAANHTAVARARLTSSTAGPPRLENLQVIWRQTPSLASDLHYGGRLVFARDGTLFVTLGERSTMEGRMQSQRLDGTLGKIVRINTDGSAPKDNPFVGRAGAKPEIFSIGNRNVQGATLHPRTGELWAVEHGPAGGDELNVIRAGRDYGWPTITYGMEYSGGPIGQGLTQKAGMEQPLYYWNPVIAPGGMTFYEADLFPAWKGSLIIGGMRDQRLTRLVLDGEKVVGEERLLPDVSERLRDVIVGPDGALYVATDNEDGRILRVAPKK